MIVVLLAGSVWAAGSVMTAGAASAVPAAQWPSRDIHIRSGGDVVLAGTYRPGPTDRTPAILFLHGVGASRAAVADNARWFGNHGYATLAIDFRGHGQSTITPRSFGWGEAIDAHHAFDWLKRRQHGAPIAVIGISMGGAASLIGTTGPLPADALVLQAVYPDIRHAIRDRIASRLGTALASVGEPLLSVQSRLRMGVWPSALSPIAALRGVRAPVMVIGGADDRYTPPAETRAMYDAVPGRKALWIVPAADHAGTSDISDDEYRQRVLHFLTTAIGPRPSSS